MTSFNIFIYLQRRQATSKCKVICPHVLVGLSSFVESVGVNSGRVTTTEQTGVCPRASLGSRMNDSRADGSRVGSRIRTRNAMRFSAKARNTMFNCSSVLEIGTRFPAISRYCGFWSITCNAKQYLSVTRHHHHHHHHQQQQQQQQQRINSFCGPDSKITQQKQIQI